MMKKAPKPKDRNTKGATQPAKAPPFKKTHMKEVRRPPAKPGSTGY